MKHSDTIPYYDDLEPLAEALGDLYYDTLADFLHFLGDKLMQDANADMRRDRSALSGHLMACSLYLENASHEIQQAWKICKPHVQDKNKNQEKDHNKKMKPQKQSRIKCVTIASNTLAIVKQGYYQQRTEQISIKQLVDTCNQQTRLYTPGDNV